MANSMQEKVWIENEAFLIPKASPLKTKISLTSSLTAT